MERDPRVNPQPGDVLRGFNDGDGSPCTRTVVQITPLGNVFYRQRGTGRVEWLTGDWRKWAANVEVLHRGENQ